MKLSSLNIIFVVLSILLVGIVLLVYFSKSIQHTIASYYFGDSQILELKFVKDFEIIPHLGAPLVTISGFIMHSSLAAGKLYQSKEAKVISLRIGLVVANGENSGSFKFTIPQPLDDEQIVFGNEKILVWPHRQESH